MATLNFGPFDDSSPLFANFVPQAHLFAEPWTSHTSSLNNDMHEAAQTRSDRDAAVTAGLPQNDESGDETINADATIRSSYSFESWVEVSRASPAGSAILVSTSALEYSGAAGMHSLGGNETMIWGPGEFTTSSINEESFMRMASNDLG